MILKFVYIVILVVIKIIIVIAVIIFYKRHNKQKEHKNHLDTKLEKYKKKIFHTKIDDIRVYHMTTDQNYDRFIKALKKSHPKKVPSIQEIMFLLTCKKFLDRNDVYSMSNDKDTDLNIKLLKDVIDNKVEGAIVEAGCWRGGLLMLMKAALQIYENDQNNTERKDRKNTTERRIYGLDTFSYFPSPKDVSYSDSANGKDKSIHSIVEILYENYHSKEMVEEHFKEFDLYDENVKLVEGRFSKTIPKLLKNGELEKIAILRIDSDYYDSVYDVLCQLYEYIQPGGYVIIDDYNNPVVNCKEAVDRFRSEINKRKIGERTNRKEFPPIIDEHNGNIYWQVE
jgi:hypothetical protein